MDDYIEYLLATDQLDELTGDKKTKEDDKSILLNNLDTYDEEELDNSILDEDFKYRK